DGIRDYKVTGVQTCALPISPLTDAWLAVYSGNGGVTMSGVQSACSTVSGLFARGRTSHRLPTRRTWRVSGGVFTSALLFAMGGRSEERRVGKECRSRLWRDQ